MLAEAHGFDASDTYSHSAQLHEFDFGVAAAPRIGIPRADQLQFLGYEGYAACFANALQRGQAPGAKLVEINFEAFFEAGCLSYDGPWVAKGYQAIRSFIVKQPGDVFPVTRQINRSPRHGLRRHPRADIGPDPCCRLRRLSAEPAAEPPAHQPERPTGANHAHRTAVPALRPARRQTSGNGVSGRARRGH